MAICPPTIPVCSSPTASPAMHPSTRSTAKRACSAPRCIIRCATWQLRWRAMMRVHVRGARDKADAIKAARAITLSPLWQCALAGGDPNWGRIVAALGACGCALRQDAYDIFIGDVQVTKQGMATDYDQQRARAAMDGKEVTIGVDLHLGGGEATAWGCDLTHGYIDENTLYTR